MNWRCFFGLHNWHRKFERESMPPGSNGRAWDDERGVLSKFAFDKCLGCSKTRDIYISIDLDTGQRAEYDGSDYL